MANATGIEWTEKTWNPVVGCTPVSPGCLNCYAATMAHRLEAMGQAAYVGLTVMKDSVRSGAASTEKRRIRPAESQGLNKCSDGQARSPSRTSDGVAGRRSTSRAAFNGTVRLLENRLTDPLSWRKPTMAFVDSMSDLFHESVPFEFIDRVFAVMALTPRHTYQVLTKRPERMAAYLASFDDDTEVDGSAGMYRLGTAAGKLLDGAWIWEDGKRHRKAIEHFIADTHDHDDEDYEAQEVPWPLPNVWLGASVEDQVRADERIPHLIRCPAAVRFLSCEPLLGPVDLSGFFGGPYVGLPGDKVHPSYNFGVDWIIVGGESGGNARPCNVAWIRSVVDQCKGAGVPVFVKQLGARPFCGCGCGVGPARTEHLVSLKPQHAACGKSGLEVPIRDRKGGDPAEWPEDLRVREFPSARSGSTT